MPAESTINLTALGLNNQPNELAVQPGSLKTTNNIIIKRDNVVESRRGFKLYGESFGSVSDRAKQLIDYKDTIIRHYSDVLQYDTKTLDSNGESIFNSFSGSYTEVAPGRRIRSIESNGNLYFTTSKGIKKISAATGADFTTLTDYIVNAGGAKALDAQAYLKYTIGNTTGILPQDSAVAYRILWGYIDLNNNTILGTPSGRAVVYNPLLNSLVKDYMVLLEALDDLNVPTQSQILDGNYVQTLGLTNAATAVDLQLNLIALAQKLDQDLPVVFNNADISTVDVSALKVCTVTLTGTHTGMYGKLSVGDSIYLNGSWTDTGSLNIAGVYTVTEIDTSTANDKIRFVVASNVATGSITVGATSNIQSGWFRRFTPPPTPTIPTTNAELLVLQSYLQDIITELQTTRNISVAVDTTSVSIYPITLSTASKTTLTNLHVTTGTSFSQDARNTFVAGTKVDLSGTWSVASASIVGSYTVASVPNNSTTNITTTSSATGTVTTDSTSQIQIIRRFTNNLQTLFINNLTLTTTSGVELNIPIPNQVTSNYFFQIYRSNIVQATQTDVLADLIPDDEMRLVYEATPTAAELAQGFVIVEDETSQAFFQGGAFLYTNENNGTGILQANYPPPFAYDINVFKNVVFYANTKTRQNTTATLLGISKIVQDYTNSLNPYISISSLETFNKYNFIQGVNEVTQITVPAASAFPTGGVGRYFLLNGGTNLRQYYIWFNKDLGNTNPNLPGRTGIEVNILSGDTNAQVSQKLTNALNVVIQDFTAVSSSNVTTVANTVAGVTDDIFPTSATGTMAGVTGYSATVTTQGNGEKVAKQTTVINAIAGNLFSTGGVADYFTLNSAFDRQVYYFWFNVNGGNTNPNLPGRTGIQVSITTSNTATQVASAIALAVSSITNIFTASSNTNIVTIENFNPGLSTNATENVANAGFTITTTVAGALNVLLSNSISPSLAVQETTQSLIRVINNNNGELVNAYYISGTTDVPGKFFVEAKNIENSQFYITASSENVGSSFTPDISPKFTINNISANNPSTVTTASPNNFSDGDFVVITGTNSFPLADGVYLISNVLSNSFSIDKNILVSGNAGVVSNTSSLTASSNEEKQNRIYYSKFLQPEAVPLVNFLDVGARNKAILRIIPLRDSLFVFKEDGLYRISGDTEPFNLALFDVSCVLVAPDSLAIANNIVYGWTTQGVMSVSESGASPISRPIDVDVLTLNTPQYVNFSTATWGLGYNSDYSYMVFTVTEVDDVVATQAYVYNNLTQTWVRWDKTNTCGLVFAKENKIYMGAGDTNSIEIERKDYTRLDYADRELKTNIEVGNYRVDQSNLQLFQLTDVLDYAPGDVIVQDQLISIYDINKLLSKLDNDPGVSSTYVVTNATYDDFTNQATITVSASVIPFVTVGDFVEIKNINPIGYNGIFEVQAIQNSGLELVVNLSINPGTYFASNGSVRFNYLNTFTPTAGSSLRDALVLITNKLSIDPGLLFKTKYTKDIGDYLYSGLSVSATLPTVVSMPEQSFAASSVDTVADLIYFPSNLLANSTETVFTTTGTLPGGLSASSVYTVFNSTGTTIQLRDANGNTVNLTSGGSGIHKIHQVHNLQTGRYINVSNSTSVPNINNRYAVTKINAYQFSIPVKVLTAGTITIETLINSFEDIRACYNITVSNLNFDDGAVFANYDFVTTNTLLETVIVDINYPLKQLTLSVALQLVIGPITIFKGIDSSFEYTPISMNNPLSLKHFREATVMYINKTFTNASLLFASDLLPDYITVPIPGFGSGLLGNDPNGENYYGGDSHSAPFRSYIPRDKARCRFLRIQHRHTIAREKYSILGMTLTGRVVSTRGYR